ncbi:MAG: glycosyltransferase family 2 protein, partial [Bacteroidales bacterium]|nr:glycosyltransferase family 2 protein [Bacteroidales bacterium]
YSRENIGVCWSMNAMRSLAETDYLVFLNDDMYVCPGWDAALASEIDALPDNRFYLSATVLQPRRFWCKSVISPAPFGEDVQSFREDDLLKHFNDIPHNDWKGATWPPAIVHKEIWDLVGGYSIEYSPGLYSDPDFSAKLYMAGVRFFKGVSKSRVYHFEARSTGRVKKNKGSRQFLAKWGITASTFTSVILQRGLPFDEKPGTRKPGFVQLIRNRLKRVLTCMLSSGSRDKIWEK